MPGLGAEGGSHSHSLYPIRCALSVVTHRPRRAVWADAHGHKAKPGAARNATFAPALGLGESIWHTQSWWQGRWPQVDKRALGPLLRVSLGAKEAPCWSNRAAEEGPHGFHRKASSHAQPRHPQPRAAASAYRDPARKGLDLQLKPQGSDGSWPRSPTLPGPCRVPFLLIHLQCLVEPAHQEPLTSAGLSIRYELLASFFQKRENNVPTHGLTTVISHNY